MLLRGLPEPVDPQEQVIHQNLRALVETATVQQAKSSASRHRAWPLALPGEWGHTSQIALSTHHYSHQAQNKRPQLHHGLTRAYSTPTAYA